MTVSKRKAFTLVELLVVISIIGMLMSLLLPAVQAAREAGRKNTCANNMRQVALGLIGYENSRRKFPGYVNPFGVNQDQPASWVLEMLPFAGQNNVYDAWSEVGGDDQAAAVRFEQTWDMTLALLQCPSDPTVLDAPAMSYVVNTGRSQFSGQPAPNGSFDHISKQTQFPADGVFHNNFDNISGGVTRIGLDFIDVNDGTSTTLMVSENNHVENWTLRNTDGSLLFSRGLTPKQYVGFSWYRSTNGSVEDEQLEPVFGINRHDKDLSATFTRIPDGYARPFSSHPGGVNATFCDQGTLFLSDQISYEVYRQLMTPKSIHNSNNGPRVNDPRNYLLNDADYR